MLRKIGLPALVLAAVSMLAPSQADARVRVGIGFGPVYTAPYPYYGPDYPYTGPYVYPYGGVYFGGGHYYHHWHRR